MPAIELKAPRVIVIEDRGKKYSLTLGRITKKQWLKYFEGIISSSENQGGKRVDVFDSSASRLQLVEECLVTASGYALPTGTGSLEQLDHWMGLLPLSHRLGVANALVNVTRADPSDDEAIALGQESVYLDAVWGADSNGVMRKFLNLRHNFKMPTAEQQRRVSRDGSRSRVVGGARNGKTLYLGSQATLAEVYDELIQSVQGYTVDGADPDLETVIEYMDTYHKVAAVSALLAPSEVNVAEEGQ